MFIINADDLGYSDGINRAIVERFHRGYCRNTTILANMGAFEVVCQIVRQQELLDPVGVHLVLTEDESLTHRIRKCPWLCDGSGQFRLTREKRVWQLSTSERAAVAEELRAQIARCRGCGLPLTHPDSHQHVHAKCGILPVVMRLCKEAGITRIRIARNCAQSSRLARTVYRAVVNRMLRRRGLVLTELFDLLFDFLRLLQGLPDVCPDHSVEVMIHPRHSADGHLVDYTRAGAWPTSLDYLLSASTSEPCMS